MAHSKGIINKKYTASVQKQFSLCACFLINETESRRNRNSFVVHSLPQRSARSVQLYSTIFRDQGKELGATFGECLDSRVPLHDWASIQNTCASLSCFWETPLQGSEVPVHTERIWALNNIFFSLVAATTCFLTQSLNWCLRMITMNTKVPGKKAQRTFPACLLIRTF